MGPFYFTCRDCGATRFDLGGVERSAEELQNERIERENEIAHLRDDYEQLRGRILGRLREEISLLNEGLHALRRVPPKVHVMVDHAERAIDGLKNELKQLRGED